LKAEKISGILFGLVTAIATIIGSYIALSTPSADIKAEITKQVSYLPPQFDKLLDATLGSSSHESLSKLINETIPDSDFEKRDKLYKEFRSRMNTLWSGPFTEGIGQYETMIFIYIANEGSAVAKDVYIDLPQHGLLMVQDDKNENVEVSDLTRRYKIPSIRQQGTYKVWAWFPTTNQKFNEFEIRIGNDQQAAEIAYRKNFKGLQARVAEFYLVFLLLAGLMTISFFYWTYEIFKPNQQQT